MFVELWAKATNLFAEGSHGLQCEEGLGFFSKGDAKVQGIYPEHDLIIQLLQGVVFESRYGEHL